MPAAAKAVYTLSQIDWTTILSGSVSLSMAEEGAVSISTSGRRMNARTTMPQDTDTQ